MFSFLIPCSRPPNSVYLFLRRPCHISVSFLHAAVSTHAPAAMFRRIAGHADVNWRGEAPALTPSAACHRLPSASHCASSNSWRQRCVDALQERRYTQVAGAIHCLRQGELVLPFRELAHLAQPSRVVLREARRMGPRTREDVGSGGCSMAA